MVSGRQSPLGWQLLSFRKLEVPRVGWDPSLPQYHTTHSQQSRSEFLPRERINGLATSWDTAWACPQQFVLTAEET